MPRRPLSTRIDNDLQKEMKKLAIDLEIPLNNLIEEAIKDLLVKCGRRQGNIEPNSTKSKTQRTSQ